MSDIAIFFDILHQQTQTESAFFDLLFCFKFQKGPLSFINMLVTDSVIFYAILEPAQRKAVYDCPVAL